MNILHTARVYILRNISYTIIIPEAHVDHMSQYLSAVIGRTYMIYTYIQKLYMLSIQAKVYIKWETSFSSSTYYQTLFIHHTYISTIDMADVATWKIRLFKH
jgi:hypothetical protein